MKLHKKLVAGLAVLAIGLVPAAAGATGGPEYQPEHPSHGAKPPKGHGYGYYCKGESKKHVDGMQRTPFAECVRAAARANRNENLNPQQACKAESKKHVKGQQGTPYSVCVKGVAQLREDKAEEEAQS